MLLEGLFLLMTTASPRFDPVSKAVESYAKVDTYRVTLDSRSEGKREEIRYFFKKPGYIRMEFIEPHNGAVLVYDPVEKDVKLRPFPSIRSFVMDLTPESFILKSARGHTLDKSDIGALLENVSRLAKSGSVTIEGEGKAGDRDARIVVVDGGGLESEGITKYRLWLDRDSYLPLKVEAYGPGGEPVEEVLMNDLEVNVRFPPGLFSIDYGG